MSVESGLDDAKTGGLPLLRDQLGGCTETAQAAELILANAAHVKNVPGRKTDVTDAAWLAELLAHGLIRASFGTTRAPVNVDPIVCERVPLGSRPHSCNAPGRLCARKAVI